MKNPIFRKEDLLVRRLMLLEENETDDFLRNLRLVKRPSILGFLNQHGYNITQQNLSARKSFLKVDYLLRDGIGIKIACKVNGIEPKANLNGTDFIPKLLDFFINDDTVDCQYFAMGTQEPWLSKGADKLFRGRPFHAIDGFKTIDEYVEFFKTAYREGAMPIIVLAMGMPKQEAVAVRLKNELDMPALFVCGGAIVDFSAERFERAPEFFRKFGLEWLYRLLMEPRRLFRRYAVGIPLFFYYVARNSFGAKPHDGGQVLKRQS